MTEKEMLKLRALRAFFYASVTLGEHLPLVHYLTKKGVRFTKVCEELVIEGIKDSIFKKTVNWLLEQSISEWYDSPEKVADHINKTDKCKSLFKEKIFVRLNTGLFAKICLDQKQYEAYYFVFEMVLEKFFSKDDMVVISEILKLCRERNYFMRYIKGDKKRSLILKLLPVTMDALVEGGFITSNQRDRNSNFIEMKIDSVIAKYCAEFIDTHPKMTLLDLTQVLMLQSGKFLMKPVINKSNSNFHNEN
jgi:hypothetical protein